MDNFMINVNNGKDQDGGQICKLIPEIVDPVSITKDDDVENFIEPPLILITLPPSIEDNTDGSNDGLLGSGSPSSPSLGNDGKDEVPIGQEIPVGGSGSIKDDPKKLRTVIIYVILGIIGLAVLIIAGYFIYKSLNKTPKYENRSDFSSVPKVTYTQ